MSVVIYSEHDMDSVKVRYPGENRWVNQGEFIEELLSDGFEVFMIVPVKEHERWWYWRKKGV